MLCYLCEETVVSDWDAHRQPPGGSILTASLHSLRVSLPAHINMVFAHRLHRPWGNWAMFNSFVTIPFQQKSPKALEVIQSVLEMLLLRREKSMKDREGNPIVPLPKKRFIMVSYIVGVQQERR